jgi:hypothetical protein
MDVLCKNQLRHHNSVVPQRWHVRWLQPEKCKMTEIELAEYNSREAAKFSYDGLLQARQRAHHALLLLLGGGAGLGALGLERVSTSPVLGGAALAASVLWFVLARRVARGALVSRPVRSWAQCDLLAAHAEWVQYSAELVQEGGQALDTVAELRKASLRSTDKAAAEYREASSPAFVAVDDALTHLATTPVAALLGAAAGWWAQRLG